MAKPTLSGEFSEYISEAGYSHITLTVTGNDGEVVYSERHTAPEGVKVTTKALAHCRSTMVGLPKVDIVFNGEDIAPPRAAPVQLPDVELDLDW